MKNIIYILLIASTSTQTLARLTIHRRSIDDSFLHKAMPLSSKGDYYDRIVNPLWYLLTRASHAGISIDTLPVKIDSNRLTCVGDTCPSSDEQAQLSLRTIAFRQNLAFLEQSESETERLVQQQEKPKGNIFTCFIPSNYRCYLSAFRQ